jgi:mercuric ion binding protein
MNLLKTLSVVVLTFLGSAVFAQKKTEKINVLGNCGMCKKKIETALKVSGVSAANWDTKTKVLTVSYDAAQISNQQVQEKVAAAGYDTEKVKATDEAYGKLHSCCQYDRTGKPAKAH